CRVRRLCIGVRARLGIKLRDPDRLIGHKRRLRLWRGRDERARCQCRCRPSGPHAQLTLLKPQPRLSCKTHMRPAWFTARLAQLGLDGDMRALLRRGGRVVQGSGLENRRGCKPTVGSNPTLSAILLRSPSFAGLEMTISRSRMPSEASAKEG